MILSLLGLSEERLRKIPVLGKMVDERFLSHRQRAARVSWLAGALSRLVFTSTAISSITWKVGTWLPSF